MRVRPSSRKPPNRADRASCLARRSIFSQSFDKDIEDLTGLAADGLDELPDPFLPCHLLPESPLLLVELGSLLVVQLI